MTQVAISSGGLISLTTDVGDVVVVDYVLDDHLGTGAVIDVALRHNAGETAVTPNTMILTLVWRDSLTNDELYKVEGIIGGSIDTPTSLLSRADTQEVFTSFDVTMTSDVGAFATAIAASDAYNEPSSLNRNKVTVSLPSEPEPAFSDTAIFNGLTLMRPKASMIGLARTDDLPLFVAVLRSAQKLNIPLDCEVDPTFNADQAIDYVEGLDIRDHRVATYWNPTLSRPRDAVSVRGALKPRPILGWLMGKLKEAALQTTLNNDENKIKIRFSTAGLIRAGANPLSVAELRLLASYPALYDENSVFLGNFDFLVRQKFMARAHYLAVWNENIHERMYGVSFGDMNHLQLAVVAKNPLEQLTLEDEIAQVIGKADSLYEGRVKKRVVQEREYALTITGRLAAVHDMDTVKAQIRSLLTAQYGRTRISTSRWLSNGFNRQEVATLIRQSITAFQDRMSDFSVEGEDLSTSPVRPHEWLYLTDSSISINLTRTAETGDALWAL